MDNFSETLLRVWSTARDLRVGATNAATLVAAAKIMETVLICADDIPTGPHSFAVAAAIADAFARSLLFPHSAKASPVAFIFRTAFDDLGRACLSRFRDCLSYFLSCPASPGRVLLVAVGLERVALDKIESLSNSLGDMTRWGLSLLRVPTEYTVGITARFYLAIVRMAMKCHARRDELFPLLNAPLTLIQVIGEIPSGDDRVVYYTAFLLFLGFVERILECPYVRTFFLLFASDKVWTILITSVQSDPYVLGGRILSRVFRIFARLSDFSCSLAPKGMGGQRLIYDCPRAKFVEHFCRLVNNLDDFSSLTPPEIGNVATSALEMILAWCDPPPLAAFAANHLFPQTIEKLAIMGTQSGSPFGDICHNIAEQIQEVFNSPACVKEEELTDTQKRFWARRTHPAFIIGFYFDFLCPGADSMFFPSESTGMADRISP
jgi:hypothetical protein